MIFFSIESIITLDERYIISKSQGRNITKATDNETIRLPTRNFFLYVDEYEYNTHASKTNNANNVKNFVFESNILEISAATRPMNVNI